MTTWDVIVVGCGGVGSAALHFAAREGASVLGLERFEPVHDKGSSHGETRVIRLSYFEHPDYVPLLRRAYELWAELERDAGKRLYVETGLLQVGPRTGVVVPGVLESADRHGLDVDLLDVATVSTRFPQFSVADDWLTVFERRAGVLFVEECVRASLDLALDAGARLEAATAVTAIRPDGDGFRVETSRGVHRARRVILSAGAWTSQLIPDLPPLEVVRKSLFWFEAGARVPRADHGGPAFFFETPAGMFYGFPALGREELKVAEHTGGETLVDPLVVDRSVREDEQLRIETFLERHLPGAAGPLIRHSTCLYTRSPDEHFLVGEVPGTPGLFLAAGLSGHGFKFASVLGEWLARSALDLSPRVDPTFLSPKRFT